MYTTWVLIANASEACLFGTEKNVVSLQCMKEFRHSESREKGSGLASDRPGRSQSRGNGEGSMGDPADPKAYEADRFAAELAQELEKGRTSNAYKRLLLVAEPHFHGLLNTHMNKYTRAMVVNNIQKDFTSYKAHELPEKIKAYIKK